MYNFSDTTHVYGRLSVLFAVIFIYWQNLFLFHYGVYVDAEIQIVTNSNAAVQNEPNKVKECSVSNNATGVFVVVNGSCSVDIITSPSLVLVVKVSEQIVNGTDYLYVENKDGNQSQCSRYISLNGYLRQCKAAFLQNKLRFHLRGFTAIHLQEAMYETLDSATTQVCQQQDGLLSGSENPSDQAVDTESPQCGNTRSYDSKITCEIQKSQSAQQNLSDVICRCDLKCSNECRCILSHHQVSYCPNFKNNEKSDTNGLLLYPEEISILNMSYSFLFDIRRGSFKGLKRLRTLNLSRNYLTSLREGIFEGLQELKNLDLSKNLLKSIDKDTFVDVSNLINLQIENNMLTYVHPEAFRSLGKLAGLFLSSNKLDQLQHDMFRYLEELYVLSLYNNSITSVESNTFSSLRNVKAISLSGNEISVVKPRAFSGLNLTILSMSTNRLLSINENAFQGLKSIVSLDLQENGLRKLPSQCIKDLRTAIYLNFSNNHLHRVPELGPLKKAVVVDLRSNELSYIHKGTFYGLPNTTTILVNEPVSCCFIRSAGQCIPSKPPPKYLTCGRLLPNTTLEVFMWVFGWLAVLGNIFVLIWRRRGKFEENQVQVLLITNLAASDMLMGIYMLIISSADIHFGRYFPAQAEYWRTSRLCKFAGMLAVSSSEASVFFVTLISIDRYTRIAFPYTAHQLRFHSARVISTVLWVLALAIGSVPAIMLRINPDLYDVSEVCINLPLVRQQVLIVDEELYTDLFGKNQTRLVHLATGTKPSMYFSIAMFLGVNLLCFFIVLFCYVEIFWTVKRTGFTTNRRGRDKEIRMAMKMAVIVLTDFVCWMPIIILGILVQSGVTEVSPTVFAWIATLILPINSSVNPFLYTMSTAITAMLRKKSLKDDTHPEMQPMNQSRAAFDMSTVITRTRADTLEKDNST